MTSLGNLSDVELLNFSSGVEKNNDTARSIVLRKSNNWDSPAEVIRAEHRMQSLSCRERRKRNYTKKNDEFWRYGKQALMLELKKRRISYQQNDVAIEESTTEHNDFATEEANKQNEQHSKRAQSRSKKKTNTKKKANSKSNLKKRKVRS